MVSEVSDGRREKRTPTPTPPHAHAPRRAAASCEKAGKGAAARRSFKHQEQLAASVRRTAPTRQRRAASGRPLNCTYGSDRQSGALRSGLSEHQQRRWKRKIQT
jgi:hypothetical protein